MADVTDISWTDRTLQRQRELPAGLAASKPGNLGGMLLVVAGPAQRHAVGHIKSQFWMIRERFDVMGLQVATPVVATLLAPKAIPAEYVEAPVLIFVGKSLSPPLGRFAILIPMVIGASWRFFSGDLAYPGAGFESVALAQVLFIANLRRAHLGSALGGHLGTLAHRMM